MSRENFLRASNVFKCFHFPYWAIDSPIFNDSEGLDLITMERRKAMFLASDRSSTTV